VTAAYPYYIGTTASDRDLFDAAGGVQAWLTQRVRLRPPDLATLQTSHTDHLAAAIVPRLLAALRHATLTPVEQQARSVLRGWNNSMDGPSAAAAIWAAFWPAYVSTTFSPWWGSAGSQPQRSQAPPATQPATSGLGDQLGGFGLDRALEQWSVAHASNPVFAPPGRSAGTAASVMRAAFASAVASLQSRLGSSPAHWSLERAASWSVVTASSAALVPVLGRFGVGQAAASDEPWVASQAPLAGLPGSVVGETWRMIVKLGGNSAAGPRRASVWAEGSYPGGQSETPGSPWYASLLGRWRDGGYLQMPPAGGAPTDRIRWVLVP
jgi:penicillin G amidase